MAAPFLSLALLVFRVGANHPDHAAPMNDLAFVANLFDRCAYFHLFLAGRSKQRPYKP
jgi:hypothetical protein